MTPQTKLDLATPPAMRKSTGTSLPTDWHQIGHQFDEQLLKAFRLPTHLRLCYIERPELQQEIENAYSGSSISTCGKVSKSFQFDTFEVSGRWCHTGGMMWLIRTATCYQLLHPDEFISRFPGDTPLPYREHLERKNREGYHGTLVKDRGGELVLSGPPVVCWWFYDDPDHIRRVEDLCSQIGIDPPAQLWPKLRRADTIKEMEQQLSLF